MTAASAALRTDAYRAPQTYRVEFAPGIREEIRDVAIAAQSVGAEGIPTAGLLLGQYTATVVQVAGWVPMGAFAGHEALEAALRRETARVERKGLVCVGWFRSRNTGDSRATMDDIQLHARAFPSAWQLAVVVRPAYQRPAQVSLYLRDGQGVVRPERPMESFYLFPAAPQPKATAGISALAKMAKQRYSPWLAVAMMAAGLTVGGVAGLGRVQASAPEPLAVREGTAGRWEITWDRSLGWSPTAKGHLEIREGSSTRVVALSQMDLRKGRYDGWAAKSAKTEFDVTLRVERNGVPPQIERTRLVAMAEKKAATRR